MAIKGWERVRRFYFMWTIISFAFLLFVVKYDLNHYLLLLVIIFLLNDLLIDLGLLKIFYRRYSKKCPWPDWFEHAPMVALITAGGLFKILAISNLTILIAFLDTVIDVANDLGKI